MGVKWVFDVDGTTLVVHAAYRDGAPKMAQKVIADGQHLSYLSKSGKFFSTRCGTYSGHFGRRWQPHAALIKDAISLGVLPKENLTRLVRLEEQRKARQQRGYSASVVLDHYKRAGIALTGFQLRRLKRRAPAKDDHGDTF